MAVVAYMRSSRVEERFIAPIVPPIPVVCQPHDVHSSEIGAKSFPVAVLFASMSMIMYWIALEVGEADQTITGEIDAWELLDEPDRCVDVDKAWHGLHAVLTGHADEVDSPLGNTVLGGTEFGDDEGYGRPRLLSPAAVAQTSAALDQLGSDGFVAKIDLAHLSELSIYPNIWDDPTEAQELRAWLSDSFGVVAQTFRSATERGQAMVILCA